MFSSNHPPLQTLLVAAVCLRLNCLHNSEWKGRYLKKKNKLLNKCTQYEKTKWHFEKKKKVWWRQGTLQRPFSLQVKVAGPPLHFNLNFYSGFPVGKRWAKPTEKKEKWYWKKQNVQKWVDYILSNCELPDWTPLLLNLDQFEKLELLDPSWNFPSELYYDD